MAVLLLYAFLVEAVCSNDSSIFNAMKQATTLLFMLEEEVPLTIRLEHTPSRRAVGFVHQLHPYAAFPPKSDGALRLHTKSLPDDKHVYTRVQIQTQ